MSDDKYACCEHCAEDKIHDVPTDGHEIACNASGPCSTRPSENTVWTENAALRATVERLTSERDDLRIEVALLKSEVIDFERLFEAKP